MTHTKWLDLEKGLTSTAIRRIVPVCAVALRQLSHIEGEPERHRRPVGRQGRGPRSPRPGVRPLFTDTGLHAVATNSMSESTRTFSVGGS